MTRISLLTLLLCFILAACSEAVSHADLPAYSTHFDPARDPFADGRAAIELAKATNRRVLIEVGGDWCRWCHVMDKFFQTHPKIYESLHQTFVMLKVNHSDANENEEFLSVFPTMQGYPQMFITDPDGTFLYAQDTAEFLVDGQYSEQRFMEFFEKWKITT